VTTVIVEPGEPFERRPDSPPNWESASTTKSPASSGSARRWWRGKGRSGANGSSI